MTLKELKAMEFTLEQNIAYSPNGSVDNLMLWLKHLDKVRKAIDKMAKGEPTQTTNALESSN